MSSRASRWIAIVVCLFVGVGLSAAGMSERQADDFARKMSLVVQQGTAGFQQAPGPRRTPFTEAEVNSYFVYRGHDLLPVGVADPRVTIVGNGRLLAAATVDLDVIARQRSTGRTLDPWSYLGGRVPVTVGGVLHTQDGVGRFEVDEAAVSGVRVPRSLLQDMVSYYSRSVDEPEGLRLDESFVLPAGIRRIEVGPGQAVVVQ